MSKRLHKAIARHALREAPNEACGCVIEGKAVPCLNMAEKPEECFMMDADTWLKYRPQTIYHSHPKGYYGFSEHDMIVAANMELTSYVYVIESDRLEKWSASQGLEIFEGILGS